jgi:sulfite reductase (NADPH) hemoprotein beta-component
MNMQPSQPSPTRNEGLKSSIPTLAGNIAGTLADPAADRFSDDDYEYLKFHGIYQQDDRDLRKTGKKWIFMVRGRLPGGVVTPDQYLAFDQLSNLHGNDTLRITSRQGFQFHGVVKSGLRPLIQGMHQVLSTTLAACGDVNRNVMAPPTPSTSPLTDEVLADAKNVNDALLPVTRAYHEIWLEDTNVTPKDPDPDFVDPLYGKTYLPRKFKIAFAIPPLNDTDVYTNCLGYVAIEENGKLIGYNLLAGGGLGMSHNNPETYPRLGDVMGYVPKDRLIESAKAVLKVHRDFGDRTNRKHSRLKYVIAERGVDWFRKEFAERAGFELQPARPFEFQHQGDQFGWHQQHDGRWFLGLHVLSGRVADREHYRLKTALRKIVAQFQPEMRLTPSQNLLLVGLQADAKSAIDTILQEHGIESAEQTGPLHRASMACPALPTCGLALAESERFLPKLLSSIESALQHAGLDKQELIVRMTGCPNGCARPYVAELGFIGRGPGRYQLNVGGNASSTRLNRPLVASVKEEEIVPTLQPIFERYAKERQNNERFGDWCERVLLPETESQAS